MNEISSNQQKCENYAEQMRRLSKAMRQGFYLEAIFIEYAIIEDRLESALVHANSFNPDKQRTISAKIKKLEKLCETKRGLVRRYFSPDLIASIRSWKERRNPLVHRLMKQDLDTEELEAFAREGEALAKELKGKVGSFNRAVDKAAGLTRRG